MSADFEPKLVTVLREGYTWRQAGADLSAGLIVGIVALPLAIAFAIASGVKPEQGLYTAIVAGFLISALGGSRVQIGGPTGAFIVIVFGIVQEHGYDGLAIATMMAGVLLVIMGFARLGSVIKFIPYPVTVGFTGGIALIIFAGQMRDFFGLDMQQVPANFVDKWFEYARHLDSVNLYTTGIALATLAVVRLGPRFMPRVPASLVAIIAATAAVHFWALPVETVGSRFGAVPDHLPMPHLPELSWDRLRVLSSPALAIALLAGIESLLSAVVADGMTGRRHRSNMELVAQGIANIASPLFGGIPATGAIARTATNIRNGGLTPVSGLVHALTLLLILLFLGRWAALIPMPALAGILVSVSYNMGEWHLFAKMMRSPRSDIVVLLVTFLLTVLIDLVIAIQVGVVLAVFLFMRRMMEVTQTRHIGGNEDLDEIEGYQKSDIPSGAEVFEINGPFFFGAADKFRTTIGLSGRKPKVLVLRMRHVLSLDATALVALEELHGQCRRDHATLLLAGVHSQSRAALQRAGLLDAIGAINICADIGVALQRAQRLLEEPDGAGVSPKG
jgi:sulfate permease, SulP family